MEATNTTTPTKQIDPIPWPSSCSEESDSEFHFEDSKEDEDLLSETGSIPKLQHRKTVIKARWSEESCMSEVLEHKGGLLISIGVVRNRSVHLSIEETLYLAELGTLMLVDDEDTAFPLKYIYEKVAEGKGGCSWEYFEVYRYLKSLGYIVGRRDIPWSLKSVKSCSITLEGTVVEKPKVPTVSDDSSVADLLKDLQIGETKPFFNVYLPNSKFRKTSPGDPAFTVSLARNHPPSIFEIKELERQCDGIPLKIVHVEHGRVSFFSFSQVELPTLP